MKKHRKHFLRQILVPSSTSSVASAVGMSVASAEAAAPLIPAVDAIGYEAEHNKKTQKKIQKKKNSKRITA